MIGIGCFALGTPGSTPPNERCVALWQRIIDDSLNNPVGVGAASQRLIWKREQSGLLTRIAATKRFVLHADEKLTAFGIGIGSLRPSVLLPFCKSERNGFAGGRIAAPDSGLRIAKGIHL